MIEADDAVFPNNVVEILATRFDMIDPAVDPAPRLYVVRRPLRNSDPVQAIGVFATQWRGDDESIEIRGSADPGPGEPTIQRYTFGVQAFVRDMDEERGLKAHSVLAKMIRSMLYRDAPLRVGLASLSSELMNEVETTKLWGIGQTRYLSNEISGEWLYLSTLEFWLETESRESA